MSNLNLATPGIWYPGQSDLDFQEEVSLMLVRANATDAFIKGEVDAEWFLNFLHESGVDVFAAADEWGIDDTYIQPV